MLELFLLPFRRGEKAQIEPVRRRGLLKAPAGVAAYEQKRIISKGNSIEKGGKKNFEMEAKRTKRARE